VPEVVVGGDPVEVALEREHLEDAETPRSGEDPCSGRGDRMTTAVSPDLRAA